MSLLSQASEGSWDRPPATLRWNAEHAEQRDAIIEAGTHGGRTKWGFKDPRTLLTLAFWQHATADFMFAGTFRHPLLVARSLEARNGMSVSDAFSLWRHYNELLLQYHRALDVPLLSFDVPAEEYAAGVERISQHLNLPHATEGSPEPPFLENRLRHQEMPRNELPVELAKVYDELVDAYRGMVGPDR